MGYKTILPSLRHCFLKIRDWSMWLLD